MKNLIFDTYVDGKRYRDWVHEFIRKNGYIRSIYGRYRRLPEVFSSDNEESARALRQGFNFCMQSASSDMLLTYLIWIDEEIRKRGLEKHIRPILTVHDSIMIEVENAYVVQAYQIVHAVLQRLPHPSCPMLPRFDWDLNHRWTEDIHIFVPDGRGGFIGGGKPGKYDLISTDIGDGNLNLPKNFYDPGYLKAVA